MIPVLDLASPDFDSDMVRACEEIGFFSVIGHGIDADTFASMRQLCREVFALDERIKTAHRIGSDNYRGFVPLGFFTPNRSEVNGSQPDGYEAFKLHWDCPPGHPVRRECSLYGDNRWLDAIPHMRERVLDYWNRCDRLADRLLTTIAPALEVDGTDLVALHDAGLTNMTLLHYPEQPAQDTQVGIHAHKDTNVITLLHPDPVGGLDVQTRTGGWVTADPPHDAMLINTGELLELWSGGRFVATPHRVVNRSGRERFTFPWFLVPRHDVVVEPLLEPLPGFTASTMPVGELAAEVWRTNWAGQEPTTSFDLGALR